MSLLLSPSQENQSGPRPLKPSRRPHLLPKIHLEDEIPLRHVGNMIGIVLQHEMSCMFMSDSAMVIWNFAFSWGPDMWQITYCRGHEARRDKIESLGNKIASDTSWWVKFWKNSSDHIWLWLSWLWIDSLIEFVKVASSTVASLTYVSA